MPFWRPSGFSVASSRLSVPSGVVPDDGEVGSGPTMGRFELLDRTWLPILCSLVVYFLTFVVYSCGLGPSAAGHDQFHQ
jgi:hypothetical protein